MNIEDYLKAIHNYLKKQDNIDKELLKKADSIDKCLSEIEKKYESISKEK